MLALAALSSQGPVVRPEDLEPEVPADKLRKAWEVFKRNQERSGKTACTFEEFVLQVEEVSRHNAGEIQAELRRRRARNLQGRGKVNRYSPLNPQERAKNRAKRKKRKQQAKRSRKK